MFMTTYVYLVCSYIMHDGCTWEKKDLTSGRAIFRQTSLLYNEIFSEWRYRKSERTRWKMIFFSSPFYKSYSPSHIRWRYPHCNCIAEFLVCVGKWRSNCCRYQHNFLHCWKMIAMKSSVWLIILFISQNFLLFYCFWNPSTASLLCENYVWRERKQQWM